MAVKYSPIKHRILIALGVIAGLVLAWAGIQLFATLFPELYHFNYFPDHYETIARRFAAGAGYRLYPDTAETMVRDPGYIFFLVGIIKLWGSNLAVMQTANIGFLALTAYVTSKLARQLGADALSATAAACGVLLHPIMLGAATRAGPECLWTLLLVTFVLMFYRALDSGRSKDFALAGFVLGAAVLTRGSILPFTGVAAIFLLWRGMSRGRLREAALQACVLSLTVFATMAPWTIRNAIITDGLFVPVGSIAGDALFQGMYMVKHAGTGIPQEELMLKAAEEQNRIDKAAGIPSRPSFTSSYFEPRDELRHSKILKDQVMSEYSADPALFFRVITRNFWRFWIGGGTLKTTTINALIVIPVLLTAFIGLWIALKKHWDIAIIGLLGGSIIAVHTVTIGHARHHMPLVPFLMIFCGVAISNFWTRYKTPPKVA